jgi:hypothetical protein
MNKNSKFWNRIVPHSVVPNNDSWDDHNVIETAFFRVTNCIRGKVKNLFPSQKYKLNSLLESSSVYEIVLNFFIIFLFLAFISAIFFVLPYFITPDSSERTVVLLDTIFLVVTASILWTGYVYVFREFQYLINTTIDPLFKKTSLPLNKQLRPLFNGLILEWQSGFRLKISILSISSIVSTAYFIWPLLNFEIPAIIILFKNHYDLVYVILSLLMWALLSILTIVNMYTMCSLTVLICFIYLTILGTIIDPKWEINPLLNLGGTERFGKLIIHCLCLSTLAIAIFPILSLIPKFEEVIPQITSIHSIDNITTFSSHIVSSIKGIPLNSFMLNSSSIQRFIAVTCLMFTLIIIIHFRIKKRKSEELRVMEQKISRYSSRDEGNIVELQSIIYLYDRISNLSEWPISGKNFFVGLIISVLPFIITQILF